ncbi:hydrogenase expression/formation protein HypE, partial [Acinetobacter baumannii]
HSTVGATPKAHRRKLNLKDGRIDMSHGAGGRAMADLISGIFRDAFANDLLDQGNDQAMFATPTGSRMVMTTDGYVVSP